MNWYKKAQIEEPPKWEYPGAPHDFDPAWEHEINENPDQEIVQFIDSYINKLKKELLPQLEDIEDMKVGYIQNTGTDMIAKYINGTNSWPVFLIDIESTKKGVRELGLNIYDQIEMSILHELGHAIEECNGFPFDEHRAEEFAFNYHFLGEIWRFWEE